jgi:hypothetical protein
MPKVSLTEFVDIVSKSGRPKASKVRDVKNKPEYTPAFDFYKAFREHVIKVHSDGSPKTALDEIVAKVDSKKTSNYHELVAGYKKWWGRKALTWSSPPRGTFLYSKTEIILNPELRLQINGDDFVVKLFNKDAVLKSTQVEIIVGLMELELREKVHTNTKFAVLDVRKSVLQVPVTTPTDMLPMIRAELAYIESIWGD